jgi:predicted ATPase/DNA-binding CsgD family transcriptional regulator
MRDPIGGLPVPLTSFVGRQRDQAEVGDLLERARLVSLVGPGGSGKTRLALQVARTALDAGRPVHWVELAPVADPDGVLRAVQTAVHARDEDGPTPIEALAAAMGPTPAVLVLDNCEHQIDPAARLARDLLAANPTVTILVTSREPLGIGGEATWDVAALPGPQPGDGLTAEEVLATDAGRLFFDRARAANPGFRLEDVDAPAVGRVIRRLDGLPLALELAAVRCRALGPTGLADALDDRFSLLVGGDRTADERQRTLLASVAWSHDLLTDAERRLLRRVAVFAGPFTARAAEAVAAGDDLSMGQVLPALIRLVDRSLVARVPGSGVDRYRLLETIRAFAIDQLDGAGEREELVARHLRFFAMRAAAISVGMDDRHRAQFLPVVDVELADLDQARVESLARDEPEVAAAITADLTRYWCARGQYRAAFEAQAQVLPFVPLLEPLPAARLLWAAAHAALSTGDVFTAGGHALNAVHLARKAGDPRTLARALAAHGGAIAALDPAAAAVVFAEAAGLAREAGDRWALGVALSEAGMSTIHIGAGRAVEELAEAQEIGEALGDSSMLAYHAVAVAWLANRDGEFVAAERHLREAIALAEEVGDHSPIDLATGFLAEALAWQGRADEGAELLRVALDRLTAQGSAGLVAILGLELANVHLVAGRSDEALALFEAGRNHPIVAVVAHLTAQADIGIGASRLALGRALDAIEPLERCTSDAGGASPWVRSMGKLLLGEAMRRSGDDAGLLISRDGLELASEQGYGAVQIEGVELFAAEAATAGGERSIVGAHLLGAARSARAARSMVAAVPGLSRGAEAEAGAVAQLGEEVFARAFAEGSTLGLGAAARLAVATAVGGGRGPTTPRPVSGWASLTPAELRVAELAARGLSNPRIAADLFISRETVKSHLSRIFVKVELSSRAELAAAWATRD